MHFFFLATAFKKKKNLIFSANFLTLIVLYKEFSKFGKLTFVLHFLNICHIKKFTGKSDVQIAIFERFFINFFFFFVHLPAIAVVAVVSDQKVVCTV